MQLTPSERRMTLTASGPSVRPGAASSHYGDHDAVTGLQQLVERELMGRPLGTSLNVPLIQQRYFLVPQVAGRLGFENGSAIDLMCAPCLDDAVDYDDTVDAWLSPYVGHDKLESIALALRSALGEAVYLSVDVAAAHKALYADAIAPLLTLKRKTHIRLAYTA